MKKILLLSILLAAFQGARAQSQHCIDFDGIDDYVEVPMASSGLTGLNAFSMACWVYPTNAAPSFPNFDGIMGIRNELNADFFMLQLSATNFEVRFRNSSGVAYTINSPTCQLNTWQHLAMVYTGSQLRFYHNGVLSQSITASGTINNATLPLTLGRVNFQTTPFALAGKLDEAAIWSRALSDSEVVCAYRQKISPTMPGLLHYYTMDQGVAGGNNITVMNVIDEATALHGTMFGLALNGTTSNFVAGTSQMTVVNDTFCSGTPYLFGGLSFSQAGTYRLSIPAMTEGCDSTIILNLAEDSIDLSIQQNRDTLEALNANGTYQWLDCSNGFSPIAGATSAQFIAPANGQYAVWITENGCSDTSSCLQVSTVGLPSLARKFNLKLYPNPGQNELLLEWPESAQNARLAIFTTVGQRIFEGHLTTGTLRIDASTWPSGLYLIYVESSAAWSSQLWQKQ